MLRTKAMYKLKLEKFRDHTRQIFFTMREVNRWTGLPRKVIQCPGLEISNVELQSNLV